jgi:hypothetical protein
MKFLILISIITLIINIIINKTVNWSLYAITSSFYICSFYSYIIIENKVTSFIINMLSLETLLFVISYLTHTTSWFIYLVGPIILMILLFVLLNIFLSKYSNMLRNFSIILMYICLILFLLNGLIKVYKTGSFSITWSVYSNIPIIILSILFYILSFSKKIQNEFEKRFFI